MSPDFNFYHSASDMTDLERDLNTLQQIPFVIYRLIWGIIYRIKLEWRSEYFLKKKIDLSLSKDIAFSSSTESIEDHSVISVSSLSSIGYTDESSVPWDENEDESNNLINVCTFHFEGSQDDDSLLSYCNNSQSSSIGRDSLQSCDESFFTNDASIISSTKGYKIYQDLHTPSVKVVKIENFCESSKDELL